MGYIQNLRAKIGTAPIMMVGACVLIFNEQRELLLQHRLDNDCWGLIGGSMELGEQIEEVAAREMHEETNLMPHHLQLFHLFSGPKLYYKYPHGDEVYNVVAAYICTNYEGTMHHDVEEASALRFFSLDALPKHISPPDQPIIEAFLHSALFKKLIEGN